MYECMYAQHVWTYICMYVEEQGVLEQKKQRRYLPLCEFRCISRARAFEKLLVHCGEGTQAGNLRSSVLIFLWHWCSFSLPSTAIVHQMGLQIQLLEVPDATGLAREYILCKQKHRDTLAALTLESFMGKQHLVQFLSLLSGSELGNQTVASKVLVLFHRTGLSL